jgi:hypothetical protein
MAKLHNEPTLENPIETWKSPLIGWEWRVLEKVNDNYWYCAVQSPMTHGTWDFGGVNPHDIFSTCSYIVNPEVA